MFHHTVLFSAPSDDLRQSKKGQCFGSTLGINPTCLLTKPCMPAVCAGGWCGSQQKRTIVGGWAWAWWAVTDVQSLSLEVRGQSLSLEVRVQSLSLEVRGQSLRTEVSVDMQAFILVIFGAVWWHFSGRHALLFACMALPIS